MDFEKLAALLFPDVTETPEDIEARYPRRELPEGAKVTRFAPSPTGFVHVGGLYPTTTGERLAHQSGGVFYLRIEDTDAKREVAGAVEVLISTLKHYGISFDEGATIDGDCGSYGPYRQRQRADIYHVYAKKLVEQGDAYPCFCTEEELTQMRERQEASKVNFGYYGEYAIWRDRPMEDIKAAVEAGKPWVLRFRSTGSIEKHINTTVFGQDIGKVLFQHFLVHYIGSKEHSLTTLFAYFFGNRITLLGIATHDNHLGALLSKISRDSLPENTRSTGDYDNFVINIE